MRGADHIQINDSPSQQHQKGEQKVMRKIITTATMSLAVLLAVLVTGATPALAAGPPAISAESATEVTDTDRDGQSHSKPRRSGNLRIRRIQ